MLTIAPAFRGGWDTRLMAINVRDVDRDQLWLMPPSITDWLPDGHLVWFVLDVVAELDLSGFTAELRADGRGGAVYDPAMMLGVLLYAYCVGERSSRWIERRCVEDVAFRVLAANQSPDHATLARFRRRHLDAIGSVFAQVLGLCDQAGLVDVGLVAIDGTKMTADASPAANKTRRQLAAEILEQAEQVDAAEDDEFGDRRGDELPGGWADRRGRRARVREALRQLEADGAADWESYQATRAAKEKAMGRKMAGRKPSPAGLRGKDRHANVTDPDSRIMRSRQGFLQGYNAQAAVTGEQIIVAAAVVTAANDLAQLAPLLAATEANLHAVSHEGGVGTVVADAGYWSTDNATLDTDARVLIATVPATMGITDPNDPRIAQRDAVLHRWDRGEINAKTAAAEMGVSEPWARKLFVDRRSNVADPAVVRAAMDADLATDSGRAAYARRQVTVEPVFGQIKAARGYRRFSLRGLHAVRAEWTLICTTHNLTKLWRHAPRPSAT